MSVLIKGASMPQCCGFCPCESYNDITEDCECTATAREITDAYAKGLPDWCPLVELPEKHGRLIDADVFMADICRSINEMTKIGIMVDGDYLWCKLEDALENAPTVVEAEGRDT